MFLIILIKFLVCQAIISRLKPTSLNYTEATVVFIMRCWMFGPTMISMLYDQPKKLLVAYRKSAFANVFYKMVPVPKCLGVNMQGVGKLFFTLSFILMLFYEPYHLLG